MLTVYWFGAHPHKRIPLKAFCSSLQQSWRVSTSSLVQGTLSQRCDFQSKKISLARHNTDKNVEFIENCWGEVFDSPEIIKVPLFIYVKNTQNHCSEMASVSMECLPHQVLSHLYSLQRCITTKIYLLFFSQYSQTSSFYLNCPHGPSLLEYWSYLLSFQWNQWLSFWIQEKKKVLDSSQYSHLPWVTSEWHMRMSAKLGRK